MEIFDKDPFEEEQPKKPMFEGAKKLLEEWQRKKLEQSQQKPETHHFEDFFVGRPRFSKEARMFFPSRNRSWTERLTRSVKSKISCGRRHPLRLSSAIYFSVESRCLRFLQDFPGQVLSSAAG